MMRPPPVSSLLAQSRLLSSAAVLVGALLVLSVTVALKPGPLPLDAWVHGQFVSHRSGGATAVAKVLTFTGSAPFIYPMTVIAAAVLWQLRGRRAGLALLLTVAGGEATSGVLKVAVARQRPAARDMLGTAQAAMSFPSGHTVSGLLLFVGTALIGTVAATSAVRAAAVSAALVWSTAIAWSRLYLGFHWLSDVIGSALLATSALLICTVVLRCLDVMRAMPVAAANWGRDD